MIDLDAIKTRCDGGDHCQDDIYNLIGEVERLNRFIADFAEIYDRERMVFEDSKAELTKLRELTTPMPISDVRSEIRILALCGKEWRLFKRTGILWMEPNSHLVWTDSNLHGLASCWLPLPPAPIETKEGGNAN